MLCSFGRLALLAVLIFLARGYAHGVDCNGNGSEDADDLATGSSEDCNGNGVPDECDLTPLAFEVAGERLAVSRIPRVLLAADLDADGDLDLVAGSQDTSRAASVSVLIQLGERRFAGAAEYTAGERLNALALADVDRDGDADLLAANDNGVSVLLNHGDATFAVRRAHPLAQRPGALAAGDLDGDGYPELVSAHPDSDSLSIHWNQQGTGFSPPQRVGGGDYPNAVALVDLDGDGDRDLVAANRNSATLSVYLNDGDRRFAEPREHDTAVRRPFALVGEDLDGDGAADLAVGSGQQVSVLINQGGAELAPAYAMTLPGSASSLAAADLDGDGDIDLLAGSLDSDRITLLRQRGRGDGGDGNEGRFRALVADLGGARVPRSTALVARDLDGDQRVDLALVTANEVALLWGDAGDASHLPLAPPARYLVGGLGPHALALGDLDGDGDLDLVTGNNSSSEALFVFFHRGDGVFGDAVKYDSPRGNPFSITLVDLDGDGDLDLATGLAPPPGATCAGACRVLAWRNDGSGALAMGMDSAVAGDPRHVTAADLDGDGFAEVVSANTAANSITIVGGLGGGAPLRRRDIRVGSAPAATAAGDLDGDGALDLAVANAGSSSVTLLLHADGGDFEPAAVEPLTGRPTFVLAEDFDGDGDVDLATANETEGTISLLWNVGGGPGALHFEDARSHAAGGRPHSVSTADVDGDGRTDLLAANQFDGHLTVLHQNADRTCSASLPYPVGSEPRFAAARDLDHDGDLDLVSANHGTRDVTVHLNRSPAVEDSRERICTELDFVALSVEATHGAGERLGKYVIPAVEHAALSGAVFQNVVRFALHEEFLAHAYPDTFAALTPKEYDDLVSRRKTREYFVGSLSRVNADASRLYTFTVVADTGADTGEVLTLDEVTRVYDTLAAAFTLRPLAYEPDTRAAREAAASWSRIPFPVFDRASGSASPSYEAYTRGTAYGRVRVLSLAAFNAANDAGRFTFQDILVIEQAPREIEGVVAGVITAALQGELSHVAVRAARRGMPNAYLADALEVLAPWEGRLVRLEVAESDYAISEAPLADAEAYWADARPELPELPLVDRAYRGLDSLDEIARDTAPAVARFGGKTTNLALLQGVLSGEYARYRESGFGIPVAYYFDFMESNTLRLEGREVTFAQYLDELLASPAFAGDSQERFARLEDFREFVRERGRVDPALVARLAERIEAVLGGVTTAVRFRSSSNVEDALEFNGAGLYESTSACLADGLDNDAAGPSRCDAWNPEERTIERALKKVWSSLWTFRAHEERSYFGIPSERAAMGILVSRAFLDEAANGVAFTGNPRNGADRRYVIAAQPGEASVVSPEPGTTVERNLLEVVEGRVIGIVRSGRSSLVPPGSHVLSDHQLRELGALFWHIDRSLPLELGDRDRSEVLLDGEFKVLADGSLAIKQVRPFLLSEPAPPSPTFALEIPIGTEVCGVFSPPRTGRSAMREYETKSVVRLEPGVFELPTRSGSFPATLVAELRFGPGREVATSRGAGVFDVTRLPLAAGETLYRFTYRESFTLASGEELELELLGLDFRALGELALERRRVLEPSYLTHELVMEGNLGGLPVTAYSSCTDTLFPEWEVTVELEDGSRARLLERFLPSENDAATGPARLVHAEFDPGPRGGGRIETSDYWQLVYTARRHNRAITYWIALEPALALAGIEAAAHVIEIELPDPPLRPEGTLRYLGRDFGELASTRVLDDRRRRTGEGTPGGRFRRGDVNDDAQVDAADAFGLLAAEFGGADALLCPPAADTNDDGRVDLTDAVVLFLYAFDRIAALPEPRACGPDPTPDRLDCERSLACPPEGR